MREKMSRRTAIKLGTGAVGTAVVSGSVAAKANGRDDGELPGNAPYTTVNAFDDQSVSTGEWVVHQFGWVAGERTREERKQSATEFYDALEETHVEIEGISLDDPAEYWSEPFEADDGAWYVLWEYASPPRTVGEYGFDVTLRLEDDWEEFESPFEYPGGVYSVDPGR